MFIVGLQLFRRAYAAPVIPICWPMQFQSEADIPAPSPANVNALWLFVSLS
jgi:hypothetical protein